MSLIWTLICLVAYNKYKARVRVHNVQRPLHFNHFLEKVDFRSELKAFQILDFDPVKIHTINEKILKLQWLQLMAFIFYKTSKSYCIKFVFKYLLFSPHNHNIALLTVCNKKTYNCPYHCALVPCLKNYI